MNLQPNKPTYTANINRAYFLLKVLSHPTRVAILNFLLAHQDDAIPLKTIEIHFGHIKSHILSHHIQNLVSLNMIDLFDNQVSILNPEQVLNLIELVDAINA